MPAATSIPVSVHGTVPEILEVLDEVWDARRRSVHPRVHAYIGHRRIAAHVRADVGNARVDARLSGIVGRLGCVLGREVDGEVGPCPAGCREHDGGADTAKEEGTKAEHGWTELARTRESRQPPKWGQAGLERRGAPRLM